MNTCIVIAVLLVVLIRLYGFFRRQQFAEQFGGSVCHVAFLHPYCRGGGGGERVLWHCIQSLQENWRRTHLKQSGYGAVTKTLLISVYTGESGAPSTVLKEARDAFNLPPFDHPELIRFVRVRTRTLVEAKWYPVFTMAGQSLGSVILVLECLFRSTPNVFIDTTGYAFTYPFARILGGCEVACYTHYPTISTDMLNRVRERRPTYNNHSSVAQSVTASRVKVMYYTLFAWCYGFAGRFASVIMVNSTWTYNHIVSLWRTDERTTIVYPSCDTATLRKMPLEPSRSKPGESMPRSPIVVSIGQFRPEKDHMLQLDAFRIFREAFRARHNSDDSDDDNDGRRETVDPRLIMIGGCRNAGDKERVAKLFTRIREWDLENCVTIVANAPFSELLHVLSLALVGIHTMWNEHFGISVVEFMAAGVVTLAHDSGGPKADIVTSHNGHRTGYLATNAHDYADAMLEIFEAYYYGRDTGIADTVTTRAHLHTMREHARQHARSFSDEDFRRHFWTTIAPILR